MVQVQFETLTAMMRYLKHFKPVQFAVLHYTDEFDDEGIYTMSHPPTEGGMEDEDGWTEDS